MSVRLRRATAADLDWILAAEGHSENVPFVTQWSREKHAAALDDPDMRHFVIAGVPDGRAVGYVILAGLASPRGAVELRRIVVAEKGRGFGRAALRLVRTMALDELRAPRLWLDVRPNNPGARRLYESEGFVAEGAGADGLTVLSIRGEKRE